MTIIRGIAMAMAAASMLGIDPCQIEPPSAYTTTRKPRKADPKKKAARKRQRKARAITRRSLEDKHSG